MKIYTSLEIQQRSVKPIIKKCKEGGTYSHSEGVYSFSGSDGTVCAWNMASRDLEKLLSSSSWMDSKCREEC